MENPYSVQQMQNKVNLYFDNALNEKESSELLNQVNLDPTCSKIFNQEKKSRDFIKSNVSRFTVPSDFIQTIKNKINL
ncbi:hypothetical protein N9L92_00710 [Saprospiraceae bacterium]|nr:hypothetical protein [Saprospiraceae bacterium]